MKEQHYRIIGWSCFIAFILLALYWVLNNNGLAGWLTNLFQSIIGARLGTISAVITVVAVGLPGYMLKNYFEGLAWNAHVEAMPPPDREESAKRSKYLKAESGSLGAPLAPAKPVILTNVPKTQEEFVATCPACGKLFPAKRDQAEIKCPQCGETVPTS
ncbi:MAG TPA: hypothetical protein VH815_11410 [Acidobacteriota bacterium]